MDERPESTNSLEDPYGGYSVCAAASHRRLHDLCRRKIRSRTCAPAETKSNTPNALRRDALIENGTMRCKGFTAGANRRCLRRGLHSEALKAQYPAALAQQLKILGAPLPKRDENDATAKALLSGDIDANVIDGVFHYLALRNAHAAHKSAGWGPTCKALPGSCSPATTVLTAGETNRLVVATCLYEAICKDDLESALTIRYPNLTPERYRKQCAWRRLSEPKSKPTIGVGLAIDSEIPYSLTVASVMNILIRFIEHVSF